MRTAHPIALCITWIAVAVSACRDAPPAPSASTVSSSPIESRKPALTEVGNHAEVCMVTDQYMGRPQIPVAVGPRVYYGCCAGCKDKLEKNAAVRAARDPVSGASVNKATAVIGREESGHILYFESRENMLQYGSGT